MRKLREFAQENSLQWMGGELPWNLPIRELCEEPSRDVAFENVFSGMRNSLHLVGFDCTFGSGKGKPFVSVIAVHTDINPFGVERFNSDLTVTAADGWIGIRRTPRMMGLSGYRVLSPAETIAIIEALG